MGEQKTRSPFAWLDSAETLWRPKLQAAGLAFEVLDSAKHTAKAAQAFGIIAAGRPEKIDWVLREHPAALVLAVTGVARSNYEAGKFWRSFWQACGLQENQANQTEWGQAFLQSLHVLGLPTFPGQPRRYLGPILMHAGIPDYCLADFFHVIEVGLKRVGADADALVQWALPRLDIAFVNVDVPVRRFLEYGGEYAVDMVDQSLDTLIRINEDADATLDARVPERVVEAARAFLAADRERRVALKAKGFRARPRLTVHLDAFAGEVELRLPALDVFQDDVVWKVSLDGVTTSVRPSLAVGGRTVSVMEAAYRLDRPIRSITVKASGLEESLELPLVRDQDPVLFFEQGGALLPGHVALPPEPVWALYALGSRSLSDSLRDRILREEVPPLGWASWNLSLVDLAGATHIQLADGLPVHTVRTQSRATVDVEEEIGWVSMNGVPVSARRPTVHLPLGVSDAWRLRVTNLDRHMTIVDRDIRDDECSEGGIDPFLGIPTPVVGRFEVSVKGPFGRGARRQVAMVEGLTVTPPDPWRLMGVGGLTPLDLKVGADRVDLEPSQASLGPGDVSTSIHVEARGSKVELMVTPPSMAVATLREGVASRWLHGLTRIALEDCPDTSLMVRLRSNAGTTSLQLVTAGETIQTLAPSTSSAAGYNSYDLSSIVDTMRRVRACDLMVMVDGAAVRVARIEPRTIATGAEVVGDQLQLLEFTGGDVEVGVWCLFAPWTPPLFRHLTPSGSLTLEPAYVGMGPLVVSWKRSDPWVPADWEWLANPSHSTIVEMGCTLDEAPDSVRALAEGRPSLEALTMGQCWYALALARRYPRRLRWDALYCAIEPLTNQPEAALLALLQLPSPVSERLELLIRSKVLWAERKDVSHNQISFRRLAEAVREDALTASMLVLPALADPAARFGGDDALDLWRTARQIYGTELVNILTGAGDPAYKGGSFDAADKLAMLDADRQDAVVNEMQLVPKAMLDVDARSAAALQLFRARNDDRLRSVARDAGERLGYATSLLRDWHWAEALRVVDARMHKDRRGGWLSLSAQSVGFALMARLAARGDEHAKLLLERDFGRWSDLAAVAPQLVTLDLVLAEAMTVASFADEAAVNPFSISSGDADGTDNGSD